MSIKFLDIHIYIYAFERRVHLGQGFLNYFGQKIPFENKPLPQIPVVKLI